MCHVGSDRAACGSRPVRNLACFAADPGLLRPAPQPDSFGHVLQRATPQEAAGSAGGDTEQDVAGSEPAQASDGREPAGHPPAAAEDSAGEPTDSQATETTSAGNRESADPPPQSDEPDEAHPDAQNEDPSEEDQNEAAEEAIAGKASQSDQAAVGVMSAPVEEPRLPQDPATKGTPTEEEAVGRPLAEDAEADPQPNDPAPKRKNLSKANAGTGKLESVSEESSEAPGPSGATEEAPDEAQQGKPLEGGAKNEPAREPVLRRADIPRRAEPSVQQEDGPSSREIELATKPFDEPSGRSERGVDRAETRRGHADSAGQEPHAHTSAGAPAAGRLAAGPPAAPSHVVPSDAGTKPGESSTADNEPSPVEQPDVRVTKPAGNTNLEPKPDMPARAPTGQRAEAPSGQSSGSGPEAGQVNRARFVHRVANAFRALADRHGPVRLKLYPPELGSLRLEIHVRDGALSARAEAETSTTRNLLLDHLPLLRERLASQGVKIERFDVDLADRGAGETSDQGTRQAPGDGDRSGRDTSSRSDHHTAPETVSSTIEAPTWPGEGKRLNVLI